MARALVVWTALVLALLAELASSGDVAQLLKQGDTAFANSEFSSAVKFYSAALDQQSPAPVMYTKRAAAYISLRQLTQALRDLNRAVELDASFVQGFISRGKLQRQLCSFDAAEADFQHVLQLRPGQKVAEQELQRARDARAKLAAVEAAAAAAAAGGGGGGSSPAAELARVRPTLDSLYEDAPDCVRAQVLEAEMLFAAGEYEQVVAVTGRVVKADERQLASLVLRGRAYFYLADHDMAKRHFGEALKYDPDHPDARREFNKVKDYDRKRARADRADQAADWVEAEKMYIEALHVDLEHRRANDALWYGLCRARTALGRGELVVEACGAVLSLNPGHRDAKLALVRGLWEVGRLDEAAAKAREFLHAHQNDGAFHELAREAEQRVKIAKRKDYYKTLGVEQTAGDREIKRAYRELAKKYHPDKVAADERAASEAQFREIAEAYEVLTDEAKRRAYDSGQDPQEAAQHDAYGGGFGGFQHGRNMHFSFRFG